ncbi:MAG: hypothetical protein HOE06_04965 [Candidatus Thioglobus sp.]|jgi:hypothetical protein|nr:hypothetical protein [Candidatus Thioglobus sp.]
MSNSIKQEFDRIYAIIGPESVAIDDAIVEIQDQVYNSIKHLRHNRFGFMPGAYDDLVYETRDMLDKFLLNILWGDVKGGLDAIDDTLWMIKDDDKSLLDPSWVDREIIGNIDLVCARMGVHLIHLYRIVKELRDDEVYGAEEFLEYTKIIYEADKKIMESRWKIVKVSSNMEIVEF